MFDKVRGLEVKKMADKYAIELLKELHDADGELSLAPDEYHSFCLELAANYVAGVMSTILGSRLNSETNRKLMTDVYDRVSSLFHDVMMEHGAQVLRVDLPKEGESGG